MKINAINRQKRALKILSTALAFLCLSFTPNLEKMQNEEHITPTLTVQGNAVISKPADQFEMTLGVVTQAENAEEALSKNNETINSLITQLKASGIQSKDYQTNRFDVRPIYKERPQHAKEDWKPSIIGYEVNNTLNVKSSDIKNAGKLIDSTARAGANKIENIRFTLQNPETYRKEAITAATEQAKSEAATLSLAAGLNLLRILSINLDDTRQGPTAARGLLYAKAMESTALEPGEVEIEAAVQIIYEVR